MIISAHQPSYNPWLGYLHKILLSDTFVIMDDVQFEKNSFINRNRIIQNNNEIMLTIPVKSKNYKLKSLNDIEIFENKWQLKHLKSIEQSYKKAKNFEILFDKLKKIYEIDSKYLIDYTNAYLFFIIDYLEITTKVIFASTLKIKSRKLEYIIELTEKLNGNLFVFGEKGKDYADINYLKAKNIFSYFQEYNHPEYNQLCKKFHSNLGIIDILFNEDKNKIIDIILRDNIKQEELRNML